MEQDLTPKQMPLVVVAVALMRGAHVLMQRRAFTAVHGGLWEFPGGKLEPGETPEAAAVRELQEELGIDLAPTALSPVGFASGHTAAFSGHGDRPARTLVILLYLCREWEGEPVAREAAEIDWYAPEGVSDLAMPPLDYPLARALLHHLAQESARGGNIGVDHGAIPS
ncbi:7,8-dihydro-8-oxoguanine triphosphatase [Novosphingobium sp. Rr 2-17]|uniref:(deoxy)nucleoside triphosphate pyrophosphohydrolase n=1 Tax=Novosphingobium sp. Rr 2-17 TaxID=555793 RepID=UPI0002699832|nr:7,8-dihydro-8-oxoguanine triphosphatase [Novosphingobium sp. Rr 2-17]